MTSSSCGTSANSGAVFGPATMVKRAFGTSATSLGIRPDTATASPASRGAMMRIRNGFASIGASIARRGQQPYIKRMSDDRQIVPLKDRALVAVRGPDWRGFLQGLL